jgi:N utilization substance protein A
LSEVKLNTDGLRYIALFENSTRVMAMDCLVDDKNDRLIFVVKTGDMGLAIGKNGENINRFMKSVGRHIEVVEYHDDPVEFIRILLQPVNVTNINIKQKDNKHIAYVEVKTKDKGLVIGRNGKNIKKVKFLSKRHHDIDDIII